MENEYLPDEYKIKIQNYNITNETTINGYKKTDVLNQLIHNLKLNNSNLSVLWAAELHISCHFELLLYRLLLYYLEDINISNLYILNYFN